MVRRKILRADLLVEIGVEELPPASLQKLADAFAAELARGLADAGVLDDAAAHRAFATPRRLAAVVRGVASASPPQVTERRGPSLASAFDADGKPTAAAAGFAKSCGVAVGKLGVVKTADGEWLAHRQQVAGAPLADIVTECLAAAVRALPAKKNMRWGDGDAEFIRPAHWLLALHGGKVVNTQVFGLKANRFTRGHRFHADKKISVAAAGDYEKKLQADGKVVADFARRRGVVEKQLNQLARKMDATVVADAALLNLVTGMVEWPRALAGGFDRRFLKLPLEVLVSCIGAHQKSFHLTDADGKLLPGFIAVANIASSSPARVRHGYERVLRARLADAEFFFGNDLKTPLASRVEELKGVLFHQQLGTLFDKTARVTELARNIAEQLGADAEQATRAARLCKADLVTDMVGEFPELQGVMGRHYAKKSGEDDAVADAIEQHYLPRVAGDRLPQSAAGVSVALADRIDSLAGLFAAGEIPSGDKDRFSLRRAALGVLRILIEEKIDLDLLALLRAACDSYKAAGVGADDNTAEQVFEFVTERLRAYYQPLGYTAAELASVMACRPLRPLDFDRRLRALVEFFADRPDAAESLAAANKRIKGILKNAGDDTPAGYDEKLFQHRAEKNLARQLETIGARARECFAGNGYDDGLKTLSELKTPVDEFFDQVMVMEKDAAIRNNRLALLRRLRVLFLAVADISLMEPRR